MQCVRGVRCRGEARRPLTAPPPCPPQPVVVNLTARSVHQTGARDLPDITAPLLSRQTFNADALGVRLQRELEGACAKARRTWGAAWGGVGVGR